MKKEKEPETLFDLIMVFIKILGWLCLLGLFIGAAIGIVYYSADFAFSVVRYLFKS